MSARTTRYGAHLWETLPQAYRILDEQQGGDLAALIEGLGTLLDAVRGTLDQRMAEVAPGAHYPPYERDESERREPQSWLLPYFADLLDVSLTSPHDEGRRDELHEAIAWRKGKGTLRIAEEAAEAVSQLEVELVEGLELVAATPRVDMDLLPDRAYTLEPRDVDEATASGQALVAAGHPGLPTLTPHVGVMTRAVATHRHDPSGRRRDAAGAMDATGRIAILPGMTAAVASSVMTAYTIGELVALARAGASDVLAGLAGVGSVLAGRILEEVDRLASDDVIWRHLNRRGLPCFPDTHEDPLPRSPDSRSPGPATGRYHPRRLVVYVAPQPGFFPPRSTLDADSLKPEEGALWPTLVGHLEATDDPVNIDLARLGDVTIGADGDHEISNSSIESLTVSQGTVQVSNVKVFGRLTISSTGAHRLNEVSLGSIEVTSGSVEMTRGTVAGDVVLNSQAVHRFVDVTQTDAESEVRVGPGARLECYRSALASVVAIAPGRAGSGGLEPRSDTPRPLDETDTFVAVDSLLAAVESEGRLTLDSTTVLGDVSVSRLRASDSILAGPLTLTGSGTESRPVKSCIRYSRVPEMATADMESLTASHHSLELHGVTTRAPVFWPPLECEHLDAHAAAAFGEPGCGVLHSMCPEAIRAGAEDGGEMGGYRHRHHVTGQKALIQKLTELAPVGITPAIVEDARLHARPPTVAGSNEGDTS